jgi:hypothetical protein
MTESACSATYNSVAAGQRVPWPLRRKNPNTGMGVKSLALPTSAPALQPHVAFWQDLSLAETPLRKARRSGKNSSNSIRQRHDIFRRS